MGNYIIDIILSVIFVAVTVKYFVKGFAKTVLDFAAVIISVILTGALSGKICSWLSVNTSLLKGGSLFVSKLLIFVLCFAFFYVVLKWLVSLINKIFKVPVLKQANKLLGGLLGAVCGLMIVGVISVALQISAHVVYKSDFSRLVENSQIVQFVLSDSKYDNNTFFLD